MDSREKLYIRLREALPRADQNVIEALIQEFELNCDADIEGYLGKITIERIIRLSEYRTLGLIK